MTLKRNPIHINEAVTKVINHTPQLNSEIVPLYDAYGRTLARDLVATFDVPLFNKSAMDGFSVRHQDTQNAKDETLHFKVVETIAAGEASDYELKENEAFRIMTGAEIPASSDTVIMFEQVKEKDDGFTIRRPFKKHENIALKGEECKKEDVILERGTVINPGTVATLATFGYSEVEVTKLPKVGVLSTGSELLDINDELERGKIYNSNTPMILSQLKRIGIEGKAYHFETDNFERLFKAFKQMLAEVDVIITTGGVSVGDFDLLPNIYENLNANVLFNKVAMRPGSVTTVAQFNDKMIFGLSGNPSACYSGFELFVRPSILKMQGLSRIYAPVIQAVLTEDFTKPNPFTRFIRAILEFDNGKIYAKPAGFNKSNAVTSIAKSNGVIVLPGGSRGFTSGDDVRVMLTDVTTGAEDFSL